MSVVSEGGTGFPSRHKKPLCTLWQECPLLQKSKLSNVAIQAQGCFIWHWALQTYLCYPWKADTSPGSTDNLLVSPVLQKAYKKGMLYTEHSWADVAIKNAYVRSFKRYSVKQEVGDFLNALLKWIKDRKWEEWCVICFYLTRWKSMSCKARQPGLQFWLLVLYH